MSFATGEVFRPSSLLSLVVGAALALVALVRSADRLSLVVAVVALAAVSYVGLGPMVIGAEVDNGTRAVGAALLAVSSGLSLWKILEGCPFGSLSRHEFEEAVIRFLTGFGFIVFTAAVLVPFYVMVMTSLKSQQALLANPLDFSIDFSRGWDLFRSYTELFRDFGFGGYLWTSFFVSVLTVVITLLFSVPGAYAVARLRFKGQAVFSRSILLIYMVPMIVLALPIYIAFSVTLASGDGVGFAICVHDCVERIPARVHVARRPLQIHPDPGCGDAQQFRNPETTPDGGRGDRDHSDHGAVSGSRTLHDQGPDGRIGERLAR